MDFLSQILPIIIYFLLIIVILVGIVLGIKIIIAIDKVINIVDDLNEKVEKISPLFNTLGVISTKFNNVITSVVSNVEGLIYRLFSKNRNKKEEMESEEDE